MSLKVGDGYVWRGPGGVDGLFRAIGSYVPLAEQLCRVEHAKQLASIAVEILDRKALGMPQKFDISEHYDGKNPLSAASDYTKKIRSETVDKGFRRPEYDWSCSVVIYLTADFSPLVRLVCEKYDVFAPDFKSIVGMEDYAAWDNTDGPEDIPDDKWQERINRWYAISHHPSPLLTDKPLVVEILKPDGNAFFISAEEVVSVQPPLATRAKKLAVGCLREQFMKRVGVDGVLPEKDSLWQITCAMMDFQKWLESSEGQSVLSIECEKISNSLNDEYALEDILGWSPSGLNRTR